MDAREQLRRYLEQRQEQGERDLMLDGMSVEEAVRLIGGAAARRASPQPRPSDTATPAEPGAAPMGDVQRPRRVARDSQAAGGYDDWREALRAAGGGPKAAADGESSPGGRGMEPSPAPGTAAPGAGQTERAPQPAMPPSASSRAPLDEATGEGATPAPAAPERRPAVSDPASRVTPPGGVGAPNGITVGADAASLFGTSFAALASLDEIAASARACTRCPLHATAIQAVPGEGNPDADFVVVGEAPGENEDQQGRPFVGASGQLLTKILGAINLRREDVFICNVIKHRPPGNRNPRPDEVTACSPYLVRQLELVRPKVILALGTFAAQTLLSTKDGIGKLRGSVHRYYGTPLVVTYHPAALLRNPAWKRPTWEDVQLARRILDSAPGA